MKLKYLPLLLLAVMSLVACSDDDDDNDVRPVEFAKHYAAADLDLTFSGNKVAGKDILFTPDENDIEKATLTLTGARFNMMDAVTKADNQPMNFLTSSIFAGEPSVTLPIEMDVNGDMGTFEGTGESKYYTFSYTGNVIESKLNIEFKDVVLKNNPLADTNWKLQEFKTDPQTGALVTAPIINVWESTGKLEIMPGFGLPIGDVLTLAFGMELIDNGNGKKVSVYQTVYDLLKGIHFCKDGGIEATYVDAKKKQQAVSSPVLAQYVVTDGNIVRLVLNPFEITAAAKQNNQGQAPSDNMSAAITNILPMILGSIDTENLLTNGIPLRYENVETGMTVFLDETMLMPVLSQVVPMFEHPETVDAIATKVLEMMKLDPADEKTKNTIKSVLSSIPGIITGTSKIELGLNFVKM